MIKKSLFVFTVLIASIVFDLRGQGLTYPDLPSGLQFALSRFNPSSFPTEKKKGFGAEFFQKVRTGQLKNIGFKYVSLNALIKNDSERSHLIRLSAFDETEGKFIRRPRFLGTYAYELPLKKERRLCLGVSYGIVRTSFSGQGVVSSKSYTQDGSLSLNFKTPNTHCGISLMQFPDLYLRNANSNFRFPSYVNVYVKHVLEVDPCFSIGILSAYRRLIDLSDDILLDSKFKFFKKYGFGVNYHFRKGESLYVFVDELNGKFSFSFLYRTTITTSVPSLFNNFEIGVTLK